MNKVVLYLPGAPHLTLALDHWLQSKAFAEFETRAIKFPDFNSEVSEYPYMESCLDLTKDIVLLPKISVSIKGFISEVNLVVRRARSKQMKMLRGFIVSELIKIEPEYIVLVTDQCLFAYLLIGTDYEKKLVFMQTALITPRKQNLSHILIFGFARLLNRIDGIRSRPEELNWGRTSTRGLAILWSHLEDGAYIKCRTIVGGASVMLRAPQVDETSLKRVLIVAPNISAESHAFQKRYLTDISNLCAAHPNFDFLYRPHPADGSHQRLQSLPNLSLQSSSSPLLKVPKIVISGTSALAIQLRRSVKNIQIFDYGRFSGLGDLYLATEFFEHGQSLSDMVDFVARSHLQLSNEYKDLSQIQDNFCGIFEPDNDFKEFEISLIAAKD